MLLCEPCEQRRHWACEGCIMCEHCRLAYGPRRVTSSGVRLRSKRPTDPTLGAPTTKAIKPRDWKNHKPREKAELPPDVVDTVLAMRAEDKTWQECSDATGWHWQKLRRELLDRDPSKLKRGQYKQAA